MNPRRRRERKWRDHSKKMIVPNFPNLRNDINTNIEESQQTPSRMNSKKPRMRHIIIKLWKANNRVIILKASREKYLMIYKKKKKKIPYKIFSIFLIRNLTSHKAVGLYIQRAEGGKTVNPKSCIWQKCPSDMRAKLQYSQINKRRGSSLPLDPSCKKHYR